MQNFGFGKIFPEVDKKLDLRSGKTVDRLPVVADTN